MRATDPPDDCAWAAEAAHPELGRYWLYGRHWGELLFTENETNGEKLWGQPNATPYVKDAFHRRVIEARPTRLIRPSRAASLRSGRNSCSPQGHALKSTWSSRLVPCRHRSGVAMRSSRTPSRGRQRRPEHCPSGPRRHDLVQAVLPLRRRALAERRPPSAPRDAIAGA